LEGLEVSGGCLGGISGGGWLKVFKNKE